MQCHVIPALLASAACEQDQAGTQATSTRWCGSVALDWAHGACDKCFCAAESSRLGPGLVPRPSFVRSRAGMTVE